MASASRRADPEPAQPVARHLDGQLALAVDDLHLAAERSQVGRLCVAVGPHDHVDAGFRPWARSTISRVSPGSDVATTTRTARVGDARHLEHGRRSRHRRRSPVIPWARRRSTSSPLLGDHDVAEPATLERRPDESPDAAVAADDGVQPQRLRLGRRDTREVADPASRSARETAGVVAQPALEGRDQREEQRVERDRDQRARHDQLEALVRQQAELSAHRADDERELADLGQAGRRRSGPTRGG